MATCPHENVNEVHDLPLCDAEMNFIGRFDAEMCADCGDILSKVDTTTPPPVLVEGRDFIPTTP